MSVAINAKMNGTTLVIEVPLAGAKPYVSKSAIAKAVAKGIDPATLTAEAVATSGGFQRLGDYKFSLNVNKA
jgi:hypothetical protein